MLCNEMYPGLYEPFRVEKYTAQLLNDDDQVISDLGAVTDGMFTTSTDARIKSSARVTIVTHEPVLQWPGVRVKLWAHVNDVSWPLGVFIP